MLNKILISIETGFGFSLLLPLFLVEKCKFFARGILKNSTDFSDFEMILSQGLDIAADVSTSADSKRIESSKNSTQSEIVCFWIKSDEGRNAQYCGENENFFWPKVKLFCCSQKQ